LGKILFNITVVPLLYFISVLPFPLLFLVSDLTFVVVYGLVGYRRDVVMTNLKNSFPEKSLQELKVIARAFYRHFCDVIFETIKMLTISREAFRKRCVLDEEGKRIFGTYFSAGRSIVGVMGHCGNWEWGAAALPAYYERHLTGVYHPLSNHNVDRLMLRLRGRFGGEITPMSQVYRRLLTLRDNGIPTTVGLIADQTPPPESAYWTTFLNQDTPVFNGAEKMARRFNYPVVYMKVLKESRGRYRLSATVVTNDPAAEPEGGISEKHVRCLENNIREQPYTWLWSHRRWKHRRKAG
jgi:Kdo2-lipid IVA lauroyltransferase/acyltransferase